MRSKLQGWLWRSMLIGLVSIPGLSDLAHADYIEDAGMGTAAVAANVVYVPAKLGYALLGGLTGGFAYVLTGANYTAAERVWIPALGGHYVLNTDHLRGIEPIRFSAPPPQYQ